MERDNGINRVLLIQPPCSITRSYNKEIQPPLGLAYLAAVLEPEYQVRILDAAVEGWHREVSESTEVFRYGLSFEDIQEQIRSFAPQVVGVSCLFSMQAHNAHRVCALAKTVDRRIHTVMGGAHPTVLPQQVLQDTAVDYVVLGEAERSFPDLLHRLRRNESVRTLDGLAYRDGDGTVRVNPKISFIENLDEIPFPARHLLPMEKYFSINMPHGVTSRRSPNTSLVTSRGCPAQCVFCSIHSLWGKRFRGRSPENVVAELRLLKERYGVREVQFEDDNLTFDKPRAQRIFSRMISEKLDILWTTPNGIALWALDDAMLRTMKESGSYRLCLAIESGDPEVLHKIIHKPLDLRKARALMETAGKLGYETDAFFVVGFPGETRQQIKNTFRFARSLPVTNVNYFIATPYPGTQLYDICAQQQLLTEEYRLDRLGVKQGVIRTAEFTPQELDRMVAREKILFRVLLLLKNPGAFYTKVIKRFFQDPKQFINIVRDVVGKLLRKKKPV